MVNIKNAKVLLLTAMMPALVHAGPTITAMLGYHDLESGNSHQAVALSTNDYNGNDGVKPKNDISQAYTLGYEFTPMVAAELEYLQTQGMAKASGSAIPTTNRNDWDARTQHYNANLLLTGSNWLTSVQKLKPYLLVGAGQEQMAAKGNVRTDIHKTTDTIANLGGGVMYRFNPWLSARGELRAVRNFDHDWWEGVALAGVQLGLRSQPAPVVIPPLVLPQLPPAPPPPPEKCSDTDNDGVCDIADKCPNSPIGYGVNEEGCPKTMTERVEKQIKVYFDTNKSVIKPIYREEVASIAALMKEFSGSSVVIEGHTDSVGKDAYNMKLSQARANAVRLMLVTEYGIDDSRITAQGFGETRPIADNKTAAGKTLNRRIMAVFSGGERTKIVR